MKFWHVFILKEKDGDDVIVIQLLSSSKVNALKKIGKKGLLNDYFIKDYYNVSYLNTFFNVLLPFFVVNFSRGSVYVLLYIYKVVVFFLIFGVAFYLFGLSKLVIALALGWCFFIALGINGNINLYKGYDKDK